MSAGTHSNGDEAPTLRFLRGPDDAATPAEELSSENAEARAREDLESVLRAASHLSIIGLWALREWVDSRLAAADRNSTDPSADGGAVAQLSEREVEVVKSIALGYSNKQIAARMRVSVKTVDTYKARGVEKLKVRNRVELVRYAIGRGWLTDDPPERPPAGDGTDREGA